MCDIQHYSLFEPINSPELLPSSLITSSRQRIFYQAAFSFPKLTQRPQNNPPTASNPQPSATTLEGLSTPFTPAFGLGPEGVCVTVTTTSELSPASVGSVAAEVVPLPPALLIKLPKWPFPPCVFPPPEPKPPAESVLIAVGAVLEVNAILEMVGAGPGPAVGVAAA